MLMFFKRELISSTFLFIGYSFTDHLVLDCLSEINRYLGDTTTYHYTIMKNNPQNPYFTHFIDDLEKRYHIRVLLVDEYSDILSIIAELNHRIRNKRVFISGAFSSYEKEIEEYSHTLSKQLSSQLISSDYRIVNGIGRRFGTHLIGYANEYLAKQGIKDFERYLMIKPFVGNKKDSQFNKKRSREKVIGQCGTAIFVFGDLDGNSIDKTSGVLEEFEIAKNQHKTIIPIAYPGMISEQIWKEVKNNITLYPYLEGKMEHLTSYTKVSSLLDVVLEILDSVEYSI